MFQGQSLQSSFNILWSILPNIYFDNQTQLNFYNFNMRTFCQKFLSATLNCRFQAPKPLFHRFLANGFCQIKNELRRMPVENYIKNESTQRTLLRLGINELFPIQYQTYDWLLEGNDLLASDRTGSGKTFAYALPVLQRIRREKKFQSNTVKFLVLCPTRELALQVTEEFQKLADGDRDFYTVAVYGGAPIVNQVRRIQQGADVIVATPGRLLDLLEREVINISNLSAMCLDEADTMLERGFKIEVENIYKYVRRGGNQVQNIMFSATVPEWVQDMSMEYLSKSRKVIKMVGSQENKTPSTVKHIVKFVETTKNIDTIVDLIEKESNNGRVLIFVERKIDAEILSNKLQALSLHGDISQPVRTRNLQMFKSGQNKVLVATDVASRGLDIPNVQLIIQINPPQSPQSYIHRSGRAGRAGKEGKCIVLFTQENAASMLEIQQAANIKFVTIDEGQSLKEYFAEKGISTRGRGLRPFLQSSSRYSKSYERSSFGQSSGRYNKSQDGSSFGKSSFENSTRSSPHFNRPLSYGTFSEKRRGDDFDDFEQEGKRYKSRENPPSFDFQNNRKGDNYGQNQNRDQKKFNTRSRIPQAQFAGFISRIPNHITTQQVLVMFQEKDIKVDSLKIVTLKQNEQFLQAKNVGFISFSSSQDLDKAIGRHQINNAYFYVKKSVKK